MGSCPASNTMYYNVSSGERKGKEVTGGSVEDKEKPKGVKRVKSHRTLFQQHFFLIDEH